MNPSSVHRERSKRLRKIPLARLLAPALALFAIGHAHADAVTDWNQTILAAADAIGSSPSARMSPR